MLKSHHATIFHQPYYQLKDLKLYCPDELPTIKANHQQVWQIFKSFIWAIYRDLPMAFAPPHIEKWCNGWQIRRHFFAYFKYQVYLGHAPIISVVFNRQRLMIQLDWHRYKQNQSSSPLSAFNRWIHEIDWSVFCQTDEPFYCWHSDVDEYGVLTPLTQIGIDNLPLADGTWYRLGRVLDIECLDKLGDEQLMAWATVAIKELSVAYECCHHA